MNDPDRFEDVLREASRAYHPPGAIPRDAMWGAIAAERRARAAGGARRRRAGRWAVGIAAALVAGVALGRLSAPSAGPASAVGPNGNGFVYEAAASDYFDRVEAVLTVFRAESRAGRPDAEFAETARGLLVTNRLLLDSPVASDPQWLNLLQDLELVLAQIAQLAAERGDDPAGLVLEALEHNSVLPRLRAALPVASASAGAEGAL